MKLKKGVEFYYKSIVLKGTVDDKFKSVVPKEYQEQVESKTIVKNEPKKADRK